MGARPFTTPGIEATIARQKARAFATRKRLGRTVDLTLFRDDDEDGTTVPVGPQSVLIVYASREASPARGEAALIVGSDGELQKEPPFDVEQGDRFTLPEGSGRVTVAPLPAGAYVRAAFVLET